MTVLCENCSPRKQCTADKNRTECKFYQPKTNDEWRRTCSAEEFAKLLSDAMWYGEQCATEDVLCENCKCPWCEGISNWLKQPHKEKK